MSLETQGLDVLKSIVEVAVTDVNIGNGDLPVVVRSNEVMAVLAYVNRLCDEAGCARPIPGHETANALRSVRPDFQRKCWDCAGDEPCAMHDPNQPQEAS